MSFGGRYSVTGVKTTFPTVRGAEAMAHEASKRRPAVQIGVYGSKVRGGRKYVCVYLNGKKLPRSAWFAGYR